LHRGYYATFIIPAITYLSPPSDYNCHLVKNSFKSIFILRWLIKIVSSFVHTSLHVSCFTFKCWIFNNMSTFISKLQKVSVFQFFFSILHGKRFESRIKNITKNCFDYLLISGWEFTKLLTKIRNIFLNFKVLLQSSYS